LGGKQQANRKKKKKQQGFNLHILSQQIQKHIVGFMKINPSKKHLLFASV